MLDCLNIDIFFLQGRRGEEAGKIAKKAKEHQVIYFYMMYCLLILWSFLIQYTTGMKILFAHLGDGDGELPGCGELITTDCVQFWGNKEDSPTGPNAPCWYDDDWDADGYYYGIRQSKDTIPFTMQLTAKHIKCELALVPGGVIPLGLLQKYFPHSL